MPDTATPYQTDWYAWTQDQARRLRELPPAARSNGLDVENLAEEVESMGVSQRQAVRSYLEQLFIHLLKMEFHPARDAWLHWNTEIEGFRIRLSGEFDDSPSLRSHLPDLARHAWADAVRHARRRIAAEAPAMLTAMDAAGIDPATQRYDLETQALDFAWLPNQPN